MKNIWILTKTNILRNKIGVLISVAGALILCLILYAMSIAVAELSIAKVAVGIIDNDQSVLSEDFKKYLTEQLDYHLIENKDYYTLSTELLDKHISVIIEIPNDFYEQYAAGSQKEVVITSLDDYENSAFIEAYIQSYLSSIRILSDGASQEDDTFRTLLDTYHNQEISLTQEAAHSSDMSEQLERAGFINSFGFYLMFSFSISIIICFMVLDDRIKGLFGRIQATPVKPAQYIIGTGIFGLILCFIQIAIYSTYVSLNHIAIGVPIPILITMMGLYSFFTIGFSLAVALALPSKNSITAVVIGLSTIGCVMGGAYFPLEMVPDAMQKLARVFPQYWVMDSFRRLQLDMTANIIPNIVILCLFTILCLLSSAVLYAQNYKNR